MWNWRLSLLTGTNFIHSYCYLGAKCYWDIRTRGNLFFVVEVDWRTLDVQGVGKNSYKQISSIRHLLSVEGVMSKFYYYAHWGINLFHSVYWKLRSMLKVHFVLQILTGSRHNLTSEELRLKAFCCLFQMKVGRCFWVWRWHYCCAITFIFELHALIPWTECSSWKSATSENVAKKPKWCLLSESLRFPNIIPRRRTEGKGEGKLLHILDPVVKWAWKIPRPDRENQLSSGVWRRVIWYKGTNVSEWTWWGVFSDDHAVFFFRVENWDSGFPCDGGTFVTRHISEGSVLHIYRRMYLKYEMVATSPGTKTNVWAENPFSTWWLIEMLATPLSGSEPCPSNCIGNEVTGCTDFVFAGTLIWFRNSCFASLFIY